MAQTLPAPASFRARSVAGAVELSWTDRASVELDYVIERKLEGVADFEALVRLPADSTGYVDEESFRGFLHQYRVKAVALDVESPPAFASVVPGEERPPVIAFRRGDSNVDEAVDISDALATLGFLFLGTSSSGCPDAMDANDDGAVNIADGIFTLSYLFTGGEAPPAPGPTRCGVDGTGDQLAECQHACP
jgi:hypothetical protein